MATLRLKRLSVYAIFIILINTTVQAKREYKENADNNKTTDPNTNKSSLSTLTAKNTTNKSLDSTNFPPDPPEIESKCLCKVYYKRCRWWWWSCCTCYELRMLGKVCFRDCFYVCHIDYNHDELMCRKWKRRNKHRDEQRGPGYDCREYLHKCCGIMCNDRNRQISTTKKTPTSSTRTRSTSTNPPTTETPTTIATTLRPTKPEIDREKLPGIILGVIGLLLIFVVCVYLSCTKCSGENCALPEQEEEEEPSDLSSDEGYDLATLNEEQLTEKAAFEWWTERGIRNQEIADALIFAIKESKRIKFTYENKKAENVEIHGQNDGEDVENGENSDKAKKKRKRRRKGDPLAELKFFTLDNVSKRNGVTEVTVTVEKPEHIYEEPGSMLDIIANKVRQCPIYEEPGCSKAWRKNGQLEKQDKQTQKQKGLPSIKIETVDETTKEDQPNEFRLTSRRGDSGIFDEQDDETKTNDTEF